MTWQPPSIKVQWGPYFAPDPDEQKKLLELVQLALGGANGIQLVGLRTAVEKIAPIFGIENIDATVEELQKELEEKAQRELDAATAAIDAEARAKRAGENPPGKPAPPNGAGGRPPSRQKPPRPGNR